MAANAEQVGALRLAVEKHIGASGNECCEEISQKTRLLQEWLVYLESQLTGTADDLLYSIESAILEARACISLGLVRPTLSSLRAQIDLLLSWLYFRHHPVEWERLRTTGKGFKSKTEFLGYLGDHNPNFRRQFSLLQHNRTRQEEEPYRLLSTHMHGQTDLTSPKAETLAEVVGSQELCSECIVLQAEVEEYLNDILLSLFSDQWPALPKSVRDKIPERLSASQKKSFFDDA